MDLTELGILLALITEIMLLTVSLLYFTIRFDQANQLVISKRVKQVIAGYSFLVSAWICFSHGDWPIAAQFLIGIFAVYLLTASIIDYQTKEVYDYLHLIGCIPGISISIWQYRGSDRLLSLILFAVLQILFFMRMYGEADAFVFLTCSLMEYGCKAGFLTYLLHMLSAFSLLGVVQLCRHNINTSGNLKEPVAFVPYITATVWFFLF